MIIGESLFEEKLIFDENIICENMGSLLIDKVNKEDIVYEEDFCFLIFG